LILLITSNVGIIFFINLYDSIYSQYREIKDKIIFTHE